MDERQEDKMSKGDAETRATPQPSLRDAWNALQEHVGLWHFRDADMRAKMNDVAGAIAAEIVCAPRSETTSHTEDDHHCYLIERKGVPSGLPEYWTAEHSDSWTGDPYKAARFPTETAAAATFKSGFGMKEFLARPVGHSFLAVRTETGAAVTAEGKCSACNTDLATGAGWGVVQCDFERAILDVIDEVEALRRGVGVTHANDPVGRLKREIGTRADIDRRERMFRDAEKVEKRRHEEAMAVRTESASGKALKELILPHAEFDDGEGNKDASVLRGRLATIRDLLKGVE